MKIFWQNIKTLLAIKDKSVKEFVSYLGISQGHYSMLVSGKRRLNEDYIEQAAKFFKVPASSLFSESIISELSKLNSVSSGNTLENQKVTIPASKDFGETNKINVLNVPLSLASLLHFIPKLARLPESLEHSELEKEIDTHTIDYIPITINREDLNLLISIEPNEAGIIGSFCAKGCTVVIDLDREPINGDQVAFRHEETDYIRTFLKNESLVTLARLDGGEPFIFPIEKFAVIPHGVVVQTINNLPAWHREK